MVPTIVRDRNGGPRAVGPKSLYRPYYAVEFSQILPAIWKQAIIDKSAGGFASETLRHVGYGVGFVQIGAPSKPAGTVRPMTIAVGST